MKRVRRAVSLRRYLLLGILVPVAPVRLINTVSLYRADAGRREHRLRPHPAGLGQVHRRAARRARATTRRPQLRATVPYSALEAFEADNQSRMFYRVSTPRRRDGVRLRANCRSGAARCPTAPPMRRWSISTTTRSAASRCASPCCCSPSPARTGAAWPWSRWPRRWSCAQTLARKILIDTLWRQAVLVAVIALVAVVVVQRATRPVRRLSRRAAGPRRGRPDAHRRAADAPRELLPLVDATNQVMSRLQHLLDNQKRFVRDTSHQLRTPLAVLKTQVQSALRGDVRAAPGAARDQRHGRACHGAGQPDAVAGQGRAIAPAARCFGASTSPRWCASVALELSPLIADKDLDFEHRHRWPRRCGRTTGCCAN